MEKLNLVGQIITLFPISETRIYHIIFAQYFILKKKCILFKIKKYVEMLQVAIFLNIIYRQTFSISFNLNTVIFTNNILYGRFVNFHLKCNKILFFHTLKNTSIKY